MIKEIFIPKTIDTYFVLSQKILGFSISKTHVRAALVRAKGRSLVIDQFFEESLTPYTEKPYAERVAIALKLITAQAGKKVLIRTALSSTLVTVKQLTLPFIDTEKIRMVLPYEIAPYLPFSLDSAVIDFIITHTDQETQQSTLLVAAIQKQHIAQHVAYFTAAGLTPDAITIDLFDLYGLYRMIPAYENKKGSTVLLDLEANSTRLLYVVDNQLMRIRSINQGMAQVAKAVGQALNVSNGQALEQLMRFGVAPHEHEGYTTASRQALVTLWQQIQFTLNSFISQTAGPNQIDSIILLGAFSTIPGISSFITEHSSIACRLFETHLLFDNPHINGTQRTVPATQIFSLSTALPTPITFRLNLLQQEFAPPTLGRLASQLITAVALILVIISALITNTIIQTRRLKAQERKARQTVLAQLQELDLIDEDELDLSQAVDTADTEIKKQEKLWFAFSRQTRTSLLRLLQDISTAIDRESIGLKLKKLEITENHIELEGSVKDFPELTIFERELRESGLFSSFNSPQNTTFKVKGILNKKLKKKSKEAS